jgi:Tol biopolymer transport system component
MSSKAKNLLKHTQLQTPVGGLDTSGEFQFSPDGSKIAFTSRVPGKDQAWKTNTDIFLVNTDGASEPRSVSGFNEGYDTNVRFSPDGKALVWLMMPTSGYEADRNRIVYFDISDPKTNSYSVIAKVK